MKPEPRDEALCDSVDPGSYPWRGRGQPDVRQDPRGVRSKSEAECGIKSIEDKRAAKEAIQKKIKSPTDGLRKRTQETKMEEAVEVPEVSDEAQAKILREVRIAAGRLGRLTLWGADMWIKDQYVDIFCRWVYLPLYAILAAISLNEST